jgi:hypothetical protein
MALTGEHMDGMVLYKIASRRFWCGWDGMVPRLVLRDLEIKNGSREDVVRSAIRVVKTCHVVQIRHCEI